MNYGQPTTLIEKQQNVLSKNLLNVYKKNRNFGVITVPLLGSVLTIIIYIFILYPIRPQRGLWVFAVPFFASLLGWIGWTLGSRSVAKEIGYYPEGIHLIKSNNKKIFISWDDIRYVEPLKAYGKIKVPDYMLFFTKPFPGYTPVSAEVAETIREYIAKYKSETQKYP